MLKKQKLRTRSGAPYLALELADATGRISGRVWNDVELLDARFAEGDAVHVLGRVEKFRDRLQLEVRALEPADADPASLAPALRRDADELEGFLEFLVVGDPRRRAARARRGACSPTRRCARIPATPDGHHSYAGGLLEHTVGVATICRELAQLHPRLRADLLLAAALVHDVGRTRELGPPPAFRPTDEGRLLGHVHLGLRVLEDARAAPRGAAARRRVRTTTRARRARPRLRCSTTRTSSTPSPRRGRFRNRPARSHSRASLFWGFADFFGPLKGRTLGALRVLFTAQIAGLVAIALAVAIRGEAPHDAAVLLAIPAALSGTLGLCAYYRGMAVGAMSVVAPIAGISAIVPVTVGLATGDRPSPAQIAGIFVALIGVGLASREHQAGERRVAAGVGLALLAALGFGGYFVPMHAAGAADFWWASLVFRTTSFMLSRSPRSPFAAPFASRAATPTTCRRRHRRHARQRPLRGASASHGLVSVTSVLASLYPVVTVVLARVVLARARRPASGRGHRRDARRRRASSPPAGRLGL